LTQVTIVRYNTEVKAAIHWFWKAPPFWYILNRTRVALCSTGIALVIKVVVCREKATLVYISFFKKTLFNFHIPLSKSTRCSFYYYKIRYSIPRKREILHVSVMTENHNKCTSRQSNSATARYNWSCHTSACENESARYASSSSTLSRHPVHPLNAACKFCLEMSFAIEEHWNAIRISYEIIPLSLSNFMHCWKVTNHYNRPKHKVNN